MNTHDNTLIITAHPAKQGFTHLIAQTYADTKQEAGSHVQTIDLYQPQWRQDFLAFEDAHDIEVSEVGRKIRDAIMWADEIVFVFPMWWFGIPAIMKNFFDHNLGANFAFRFVEGKPEGLLTGKTARIFTTADGPSMLYTVAKPFFALPLTKGILGFCGISTRSVDIFANRIKWKGTSTEEEILKKVANRAKI